MFFLDLFPNILEFIKFLNLKVTKIDDVFGRHENATSGRSQVRGPGGHRHHGWHLSAGGPTASSACPSLREPRMSWRQIEAEDVTVHRSIRSICWNYSNTTGSQNVKRIPLPLVRL